MQKEMPEIKPGMLVKVPGSGVSGPRMFPSWLIVLKVAGKYFSGLNITTATWQDGKRTLGIESTDCLQLNSIEEIYEYNNAAIPSEAIPPRVIWDILSDRADNRSIYGIWRKIPVREMTVDEISKKLGYPVKIVVNKGDEHGRYA